MTDVEAWQGLLKDNPTVEAFNANILPHMKTLGDPFKTIAAKEAKRRGYRPDKALGIYLGPVVMKPVKGVNVVKAGWSQGTLYVQFASGATWAYDEVDNGRLFTITRSPFPDRIFSLFKEKHTGKSWKVETPPSG